MRPVIPDPGNRIHRADFKSLAREFRFWQGEQWIYWGDQTAMFFKDPDLGEG